jgi:hypothetical protein
MVKTTYCDWCGEVVPHPEYTLRQRFLQFLRNRASQNSYDVCKPCMDTFYLFVNNIKNASYRKMKENLENV